MVRSGAVHYEENKTNVLFMGTSRILAGIAPTVFDALSGGQTYSYNLALPALPISASYFVLEDYLAKNPPPQWIIMQLHINRCRNCGLFNYYSHQGLNRPGEVLSLFMNSPSKTIVLSYLFPFKMYKFFTVLYLYNGIFHPERLRELQDDNQAILSRMKKERGYYFIEEQAVTPDNRLPGNFGEEERANASVSEELEFDPFEDPFVEKFFTLTRDKGINVLLIQPVYRENQVRDNTKMSRQFEMILKAYSHVFLAKEGWRVRRYDNRFFSDRTHLNKDGAKRYTREIYREFLEKEKNENQIK
jgi:hypothetical protein